MFKLTRHTLLLCNPENRSIRPRSQAVWTGSSGSSRKLFLGPAAVEVTLPAAREYAVDEDVDRRELPKTSLKTERRIYCPVLI